MSQCNITVVTKKTTNLSSGVVVVYPQRRLLTTNCTVTFLLLNQLVVRLFG